MAEKPILFSGEMVRAILAGIKTQTRRVMKPQPSAQIYQYCSFNGFYPALPDDENCPDYRENHISPYGVQGDRLWVRETWMPDAPCDDTWPSTEFYGCKGMPLSTIPERYQTPDHCLYRATWNHMALSGWRPSIFMPRWASRITLEVTGVHAERLQDISENDAQAEGCHGWEKPEDDAWMTALDVYKELWNKINAKRGFPWSSNPWVWVVSFRLAAPQQRRAADVALAQTSE